MDRETIAARTAAMQALTPLERQTAIMRSTNVIGQARFIARVRQIIRDKHVASRLSPPGKTPA